MPITSIIANVNTDSIDAVVQQINELPDATVTDIKDNNLVIVTDTRTRQEDRDIWVKLDNISGVNSLNAIYHNFEDLEVASDE